MRLKSLDSRDSYHPLAALVESRAYADWSEVYALGLDLEERYTQVSINFHEITHMACVRTTRFGFWLARVAAESMAGRVIQFSTPIILPPVVEEVLAGLAAILEGLALYGQLDYETESEEDLLPFPITKLAMSVGRDSGMLTPLLNRLRFAREQIVFDQGHTHGLLRALFIDGEEDEDFYFVGYLYVKAVATVFALRQPTLRESRVILPLLVKLFCDHKVFEQAITRELTAADVVQQIHATVLSIADSGLDRLVEMLKLPAVRERFDNWDIILSWKMAASNRYFTGNPLPVLYGSTNKTILGSANSAP